MIYLSIHCYHMPSQSSSPSPLGGPIPGFPSCMARSLRASTIIEIARAYEEKDPSSFPSLPISGNLAASKWTEELLREEIFKPAYQVMLFYITPITLYFALFPLYASLYVRMFQDLHTYMRPQQTYSSTE